MTYEQYEAALAAWERHDYDYYAGNRPDPPGRPPAKPAGYDAWVQAGKPGSGTSHSGDNPYRPRDWMGEAQVLYPWLPQELLELFVTEWKATGGTDPQLALMKMRASDLHAQYFPGYRRDDGTFRFESEVLYQTQLRSYGEILFAQGLNPDLFASQFVNLIEGDVAPDEFARRVNRMSELVEERIPQAQEWFASNFGIDMRPETLFAMAISPEIGEGVLERRISQAEIGGEAARMGFNIDVPGAATYLQGGLDAAGAREFFGAAARQIPTLNTLAGIYDSRDRDVDLAEYGEGVLFGTPGQQRRFRRLLGQSAAAFTGLGVGVQRDQGGALTGLRPR